MKTWKIFMMVIAVSFSGTALVHASQLKATAKTNVVLLQYKKIAVIKFKNPNSEPSGQEAADILALGFVKQCFNVVASSQIASLVDQDDLYTLGLTPEIKARLKSSGIDAVVLGTVNEYYCSLPGSGPWLGRADANNRCMVAVTAKMLDLDSGEIVWGATGTDAQEGKWTTADSVLRTIMQKMQETVPNLSALREIAAQKGATQQRPPAAGPSPGK